MDINFTSADTRQKQLLHSANRIWSTLLSRGSSCSNPCDFGVFHHGKALASLYAEERIIRVRDRVIDKPFELE